MNCEAIQHQLLESESPDRPEADVQAHLDGCNACREYQGRLLQIELGVRRLHVPSSATRDAFLLDLILPDNPSEETVPAAGTRRATAASVADSGPVVRLSTPVAPQTPWREVAWRWRYAAAGIAAALALFAFVSWKTPDHHQGQEVAKAKAAPDPLVAKLMQQNLTIVVADKQAQRAEALSKMADALDRESQAVAQSNQAPELAKLLSKLRNDILERLNAKPGTTTVAAAAPDGRRVEQLQRNRGLIQTLVEGGLRLANVDDSLGRADSCRLIANQLAGEIRASASARESDRAAEMGDHLRDLLRGGIAVNLRAVRKSVPVGSLREKEMEQVRDWVKDVAQPLEDQLAANSDLHTTAEAIRGARKDVENAVRV